MTSFRLPDQARNPRWSLGLLISIVALASVILAADLLVPLGLAVWIPYIAVVLLSLWFPGRWPTWTTTAVCTLLLVVGLFVPYDQGPLFLLAAFNRFLGAAALWLVAFMGLAVRRANEVEEMNRRLQSEIVERTRLQAQLLRRQRLESIGSLASGLAHDFNNLLTPMLMSVKLLREDRAEAERFRLLDILETSAMRSAAVVKQLLAFAGGEAGERRCLFAATLAEVAALMEHTLDKSIQFACQVATDLKPVMGDVTQLTQVFINLCVNGKDAMSEGGKLTLAAQNVTLPAEQVFLHGLVKEGTYVAVSVRDTGVGMKPDVLDQVFDPFFTTKGPGGGTGLGLATAMGIVKSHDGFIDVASEIGLGSCFTVYFPAATSVVGEIAGRTTPPARPGGGEKILLVDDEPSIREIACVGLEDNGYITLTAANTEEALEVYRRHSGDIAAIVLDMMMPGRDGAACLRDLLALDRNARVVLTSGLRVRDLAKSSEVNEHVTILQKPYTERRLLTALETVLDV